MTLASHRIHKPKVGKDYNSKERVWHLYGQSQLDGSYYLRVCDGSPTWCVYHPKGKPVRVCKKCMKGARP